MRYILILSIITLSLLSSICCTSNKNDDYIKELLSSNKPQIEFRLFDKNKISFNERLINVEDIEPKITALLKLFSDEQKANHIIKLKTDKTVSMNTVQKVKEQIQKAKSLRINYHTN